MTNLTISAEEFDGGIILRLNGSADIAAADAFGREVMRTTAQQPRLVVLDFAGVTDISSLFAGQLISLHNGLKHHAGRATIAAPISRVKEALQRMRIHLVMPVFPTVEQARTANVG
jgi:anti-anti-sigma factor